MRQPLMDWEAIKAEVHRRGYTFTKIANDSGIHPTAVRNVKNKHHRRAEAAIAAFIEQKPHDLWPERYGAKLRIISNAYKQVLSKEARSKALNRVKAS